MTMTLIETKTLGTAAASVEFTSVPQTFTDLLVFISGRTTRAVISQQAFLRIGTALLSPIITNYNLATLDGNGSTVSGDFFEGNSWNLSNATPGSNSTANTFGNSHAYILDYTSSSKKSVSADSVAENNATQAGLGLFAGTCTASSALSAITEVIIFVGFSGQNFEVGSTFSLYGITKGSDGIVTTS